MRAARLVGRTDCLSDGPYRGTIARGVRGAPTVVGQPLWTNTGQHGSGAWSRALPCATLSRMYKSTKCPVRILSSRDAQMSQLAWMPLKDMTQWHGSKGEQC